MSQKSALRKLVAVFSSLLLGPIMVWAGLIAALTLIQQVLAGFFDLSQASWSSFLNPMVWFGVESIGGTGGIFDALVGGAGAPGGTVNRYVSFLIFAAITALCYSAIKAAWSWVKKSDE